MLTLFRWLVRLTVGLLVGAVLAVVLVWYFAVRSLPDYQATHVVAGIDAPVEIVRTTEDVPHIFAGSDHDAFFALGLAHAQDRLFQMTILRRAAQGRLSEVYGPRSYPADDLARRLGLWRHAAASVAAQDDATKVALQAYADGVNAWITLVNQGARGRGAPEFFLYSGDIPYWQPADSLAILKLIAAGATDQITAEVLRARLSIVAPERGQDIVADGAEPPLPSYAGLFGAAHMPSPDRPASAPGDAWFDRLAGYVPIGAGASANGFAAVAARTAAGAPLLANDPHVALTAPSLWYLARIQLASGGVIGGTIPGIPAVLSGRNPHLAWGLTPARIDDQDVVMEEVQPGDSEPLSRPRRLGRVHHPAGSHPRARRGGPRHHPARDRKRPGHPRRAFRPGQRDACGPCRGAALDGAVGRRHHHVGADRADAGARPRRRRPGRARHRRAGGAGDAGRCGWRRPDAGRRRAAARRRPPDRGAHARAGLAAPRRTGPACCPAMPQSATPWRRTGSSSPQDRSRASRRTTRCRWALTGTSRCAWTG